ncbi:MAG TPA: tetratricopeptide repeat protein [Holophagaceae bacterium]|nr:tetratricopeptide repeat protein [Holophagaceae bacterium]
MRAALLALLSLPLASQPFDQAYFATTDPKAIMVMAADRARTLRPLDSRLQAEYGRAYLAAGARKKADESFASALQLDPEDSETRALLARAWIMNGFRAEGMAALEPLRKPTLKHDSGYAAAAVLLLECATPEEADAMMEVAFLKEPKDWRDCFEFGEACLAHDRMPLALKWLKRAAAGRDAPDDLFPHILALVDAGHPREASEVMEAGDPKNKDHRDHFEAFGEALYEAGEPALGAEWLRRAKVGKNKLDDTLREGFTLLHQGDAAEAEKRFKAAAALEPKDAGVHRLIALAWLRHGAKAEALAALEPLRSGKAEGMNDVRRAARDLLVAGLPAEAGALMEQAWSKDRKAWEDCLHFADACVQARQPALALAWYRRGALKKEAKENLTKGAIDLLDAGHPAEAKATMELAYRLDPADWEDCCEFGRAAVRNKDLPLAAQYFARAVEKNPLEHGMWNEIALAYADQGAGIRNHFWLQ